jgi:hypothetical protein
VRVIVARSITTKFHKIQCFGSGSGFGLDPDSIRSVDPYPGWQKCPTKIETKLRNFMF